MPPDLGVAIVGGGKAGAVHAAALRGLKGAVLRAVADPADAGEALARSHGADYARSFAEVLARSDIDVVTLCTPSGLHCEQSLAAAAAGKHVIVEKPMATSLEDADRMVEVFTGQGVKLAVVHQRRFGPDIAQLKRALEDGALGKVLYANAKVYAHRTANYYRESGGWRGTQELDGGGALINQGIHCIDILNWVVGPVQRVFASTARIKHRIETEDTAHASLVYSSLAMGSVEVTTCAYRKSKSVIEVEGTLGRVTLDGYRISECDGPKLSRYFLDESDPSCEEWSLHRMQFQAIFDALRRRDQPPVSGHDAREALRIVLAIYESSRSGLPVDISSSVASCPEAKNGSGTE